VAQQRTASDEPFVSITLSSNASDAHKGIIDISLYNVSDYATNNMDSGAIHIGMDLVKRSVRTNKKAYDKLFNVLLVNVIAMPWMLADTSSSAGQSVDPLSLLSALSFQSNRHRTYAQHLEQGFLQLQERDTKPPLGEASERFLSAFPRFLRASLLTA
jgi:hypothetical protein